MIDLLSPNFDDRKGGGITHLILHYTGMKTAQEALDRLTDPSSKVSAHYTVDETGTVYRHVSEDKRAWHAGVSFWRGEADLNSRSIGIEIVNPGHEFGYRSFPDMQVGAVIALCADILTRHPSILAEHVLAHSDIAPMRKDDPGELFPWRTLAVAGVGLWPDPSDEDAVKAAAIDMDTALLDLGYDPAATPEKRLLAFQRHYVPESFSGGMMAPNLMRTRLYALLAGHVLASGGGA